MIERRRMTGIGCAALTLFAAGWIAVHTPLGSGREIILTEKSAANRAGEYMAIVFPAGQVRVNTAAAEELCRLKGVGSVIAQAIITERETNGPFYFPEDLLGVKGIGPKKLAGFVEQITME